MKLNAMLFAMLLGFGIAGCEQPAEQDEPEQVDPETEATMESAPETEPMDVETSTPEARDMETTTQEAGETEEAGEGEETEGEEPPPANA